uniref:Response regulatory domain-containing protein n=1 Tax=Chromera velia CCMP2878 TaxID=1169474 RepID=A0A0G4HD38_9ALVE|eukprot:Cvel_26377.t1-p1 / transcript=Cvel_26377.t1 / gene=Cvel_26377 / organism=Chromera_velia_CCMP2878 / gene_product=hypothetical protein / transcript_product=hypothetical protein / location=Cvel_scaffold3126:8480-13744(+) / protein_length=877 / sequence_SO=supercontig / SO=protein_coding / is_pseudo=false
MMKSTTEDPDVDDGSVGEVAEDELEAPEGKPTENMGCWKRYKANVKQEARDCFQDSYEFFRSLLVAAFMRKTPTMYDSLIEQQYLISVYRRFELFSRIYLAIGPLLSTVHGVNNGIEQGIVHFCMMQIFSFVIRPLFKDNEWTALGFNITNVLQQTALAFGDPSFTARIEVVEVFCGRIFFAFCYHKWERSALIAFVQLLLMIAAAFFNLPFHIALNRTFSLVYMMVPVIAFIYMMEQESKEKLRLYVSSHKQMSTLSHDIGTPVVAMRHAVELLETTLDQELLMTTLQKGEEWTEVEIEKEKGEGAREGKGIESKKMYTIRAGQFEDATGLQHSELPEAGKALRTLLCCTDLILLSRERILAFVKSWTGGQHKPKMAPVDLKNLLHRLLTLLESYALVVGAVARFEARIDAKIGSKLILSDPNWLWHMLLNLGSNAVKYAGGLVVVEVSHEVGPDGRGMLLFSVKDWGKGTGGVTLQQLMDSTDESRKVKEEGSSPAGQGVIGGSGIGLFSVVEMAEGLQGSAGLEVNQERGLNGKTGGSNFWFKIRYLRLSSKPKTLHKERKLSGVAPSLASSHGTQQSSKAQMLMMSPSVSGAGMGRRLSFLQGSASTEWPPTAIKRVLIVEDDPLVREISRVMLTKNSVTVEDPKTALEAFRLLKLSEINRAYGRRRKSSLASSTESLPNTFAQGLNSASASSANLTETERIPPFDAVLVDIYWSPSFAAASISSGLEFCKAFKQWQASRRLSGGPALVAVSSESRDSIQSACSLHGFEAFVPKPCKFSELRSEIQKGRLSPPEPFGPTGPPLQPREKDKATDSSPSVSPPRSPQRPGIGSLSPKRRGLKTSDMMTILESPNTEPKTTMNVARERVLRRFFDG